MVDGLNLRPQVADHHHMVRAPGVQAPDGAVRDCEVLLQN